ncbi:MAG TPA: hypothetical protein VMP67_12065 [Candidatus Limnocylindria bacterium]|nr:hypothetical protein [Candidatus Limnocylindria bacterium]
MGRYETRGHPKPLAFVRRVVESGRPPHALLLTGPARVGKATLARDLAAGLLCLAADPAERPCRECSACRKLEHGNHPDLHLLAPQGAGGQIRLGQVQALAGELALLPLEGRFRVAIVERAQRLNIDAQNALLKTLEEPPAETCIVLAADDGTGLLATVVSRCARLRLGPVASDSLIGLLEERGAADAVRGAALARLAGGRPGLALALAGAPEAVILRAGLARTLISLLQADRWRRLAAQAELLDDAAALARLSEGTTEGEAQDDAAPDGRNGPEPSRQRRNSPAERRAAVAALIAVWRDVARDLALAARGARSELVLRDLLDELVEAAPRTDSGSMGRFLQRLDNLGRAVDAYANPELVLDVLLLEWPSTPAVSAA